MENLFIENNQPQANDNQEQSDNQEQKGKKKGIGFTWKDPESDDLFKANLENWKKSTGSNGGAQDYILWLMTNANTQENQNALTELATSVGANQILEAHRIRNQADERMVKTIIDMIANAKATAEFQVKTEIESLRKNTTYLREQCEKAEIKITEITQANKTAKDENNSLNDQLAAIQNENTDIKAQLDKLTKEHEQNLKEKSELEKALIMDRNALDSIKNECLTLKENIINLRNIESELKAEIDTDHVKIAGLEERLNIATETAQKDEQRFKAELETAKAETKELQKIERETQAENAKLKAELTTKQATIEQMADNLTELKANYEKEKQEIKESLNQSQQEKQKQIENCLKLESQANALKQELETARAETAKEQQAKLAEQETKNKAQAKITELEKQQATAQASIKNLENEITRLKAEIEKAKAETTTAKAETKEIQKTEKDLQARNSKLETELAGKQATIDQLKENIAELKNNHTATINAMTSLAKKQESTENKQPKEQNK